MAKYHPPPPTKFLLGRQNNSVQLRKDGHGAAARHLPPPTRFLAAAHAVQAKFHHPHSAQVVQRMEEIAPPSLSVEFRSERVAPSFADGTMNSSHMRAKATLSGNWAGAKSGFVQIIRKSVRTCVYRAEVGEAKVTVTRRLPDNTLDGLSGDSPEDLFYSRSGYAPLTPVPWVDDKPSFEPEKEMQHSSMVRCYLSSVSISESFHLMYVSEVGGRYWLWWEGAWGHNLTAAIEITKTESTKFKGRFMSTYKQGGLSGSVSMSNGAVLSVPREIDLAKGRFATSYGGEINTVVHS